MLNNLKMNNLKAYKANRLLVSHSLTAAGASAVHNI